MAQNLIGRVCLLYETTHATESALRIREVQLVAEVFKENSDFQWDKKLLGNTPCKE